MLILITHITIALLSLVAAGASFLKPSERLMKLSYWLVGATLLSGTILVVASRSPLRSACLSGLAYLGAVSLMLVFSRHKLETSKN